MKKIKNIPALPPDVESELESLPGDLDLANVTIGGEALDELTLALLDLKYRTGIAFGLVKAMRKLNPGRADLTNIERHLKSIAAAANGTIVLVKSKGKKTQSDDIGSSSDDIPMC